MTLTWLDYLFLALYMLAVIVIGAYFSRGKKTTSDYLLGGRAMPWLAIGISCMMSALSTYSIVMVPGEIYNHGLSFWALQLIKPIFAIVAFTLFVKFYFKLQSFTPFEYLEYRYDAKLRTLIAFLYTYTRIVYLAMVLFATSKVFAGGAGWDPTVTILVVGLIGIVYTVMGGMRAIVWTDVMQFGVLVGGIGYAVVVLCQQVDGGFFGAISYALENERGFTSFYDSEFYTLGPYIRLSFWLLLINQFIGPLTEAASNQINIQRLLSTSSYRNAFKAQVTSSVLSIPSMLVLWFIGLAIFSFFSQHPDLDPGGGDVAFFTFVSTQLPSPIPGLILAAMMAAVMSTLDSGINSMATIWVKEFHIRYFNRSLDEEGQVRVSKIATILVGIFAVAVAISISGTAEWLGQTVVEATTIFNLFQAIMFPAFLYAVLSRRANSTLVWIVAALLWGLKAGTLVWYTLSKRAVKVWAEGDPLGYGGPISAWWILVPLAVSAVLFLVWYASMRRSEDRCLVRMALSLFPLGFAIGTGLWYYYSHTHVTDAPLELSFLWTGLPTMVAYLFLGAVGLLVSPVQPPRKWRGLVLSEINMEIPTEEEQTA